MKEKSVTHRDSDVEVITSHSQVSFDALDTGGAASVSRVPRGEEYTLTLAHSGRGS